MASSSTARHVFLTGPPGVGKTTLVRKVSGQLVDSSIQVQGFFTEEVREGGKRTGFDIITLDGQRGTLAKVGGHKGPKVGQYTVNLQSFESVALHTLSPSKKDASAQPVYIIDEVGKMELFSQSFVQTVRRLLDKPDTTILGTIPVPKGRPLGLVDEIRDRPDIRIITISKDNRDTILNTILDAVKTARTKRP